MGDMLQKKIYELFSGMSNVFSITYDKLISGFDEWDKDHDKILKNQIHICRKANL